MLQMIINRSPSPKLKPLPRANKQEPLPRAACAASPSPYGGECKQKPLPRAARAAFPSPYGGE